MKPPGGILCFQVDGEILHSSAGVGAFVNVGAAIDGVTLSLRARSSSSVLQGWMEYDGMLVDQQNPETQHAFPMT